MPLLVFALLSLLQPGTPVQIGGLSVPVPRVPGLLLEKLASERSGEKGDRDLLVALGLLLVASPDDGDEPAGAFRALPPDLRHSVLANLATLSLLEPRTGMPDPALPAARAGALESRQQVPLRLGAELLTSRHLALSRFP